MTLNTPTPSPEKAYQPELAKSPAFWKWEKKHWLLAIALVCLVLFWFGSNMLEVSLVKKAVDWLPVIGTVAFAAEKVIKLAQ